MIFCSRISLDIGDDNVMNYYNDSLAGKDSPLELFDDNRNKRLAYQNIKQYLYDTGLYDPFLDDPDFNVLDDSTNRLIQYLLKGEYSYSEISRINGCKQLIDNWIKSDIFRLKSIYSMNYAKTKGKESTIKTSTALITKFNELSPEVRGAIIIALTILGIVIASYRKEPIDLNNPNFGRGHNTNNAPYEISQTYDYNESSGRHK